MKRSPGPRKLASEPVFLVEMVVKRFEREADAGVKNKLELASALRRIQAYNRSLNKGVQYKLLSALMKLASPHPPVEER
ncbi:MAG: hypothetical protein QXK12_08020 [Candidatus Nezhaarchaeales archaeon]